MNTYNIIRKNVIGWILQLELQTMRFDRHRRQQLIKDTDCLFI